MACTCSVRQTAQDGRLPESYYDHEDFCAEASITKGEVVQLMENGSGSIIDDYCLLLEAGLTLEEAKQQAVADAVGSVSCFLGLGSCGGSGCKHA